MEVVATAALGGRPVSQDAALKIWRLVSRRDDIIVRLSAGFSDIPIYCVHSIGGDLTGYDSLAKQFGSSYSFYGIQAPKSLMNASALPSIEGLAKRYVNEIEIFQPRGPLVLAGYSAGAVIALEIAQQLIIRGRDIPLLVAFDGAPCNTSGLLKPWHPKYIARLICNIPWRLACLKPTDLLPSNIKSRSYFKQIVLGRDRRENQSTIDTSAICSVLGRRGWPKEQQDFMKRMYNAMITYVPKVYASPVILYEVKAQPFLKLLQLAAAWRTIAPTCEVRSVPFLRHSDFFGSDIRVRRVVRHLDAALRKLDRPTTAR